jgi:general secretion pathway protein D
MRSLLNLRLIFVFCAVTGLASAQIAPSKPPTIPEETPPQQPQQQPAQPRPAQPQTAQPQPGQPQPAQPQPGQPAGAPAQPATQPQVLPPSDAPRLADSGGFMIPNATLTEMIQILAQRLKINFILDPNVKGSVSVYTYGEVKPVDYMPLLETLLRVNGATMVKVGDWYRIIPINKVSSMPLQPLINADNKTLPDDERMVMNMIFLKYATANEMLNLLKPFFGEYATASVYEPANLLIIQDNARSMRRTMDLIGMFDGEQFAGQRVRLFELENARPSDMAKELDQVFKAYAMSDKAQAVRFLPVDRINTLIAVAPNPGVFQQVQSWIQKLDVVVKTSAGSVNTFVYRLKYGRAETVAMAIMALYTGNTYALVALAAAMQMQNAANGGAGVMGGGMYGGGFAGGGMYNTMGTMGAYPGVGGYPGTGGYGGFGGYPGTGAPYGQAPLQQSASAATALNPAPANPADLTGNYLGQGAGGQQNQPRIPHVIPNPFDNTILIQGTQQEYEQILNLLRQLDIPPRQVLIDAKIYEVDLTGAFAAGVTAFLEQKDAQGAGARILSATSSAAGLTLNAGALVLRSHELLAALNAKETKSHTRVISAPSIIATDSIPASLNVGTEVPVLTSQAVTGVQQNGSSLFTNTVANRSTGVSLNFTARVNSSGMVTLIISQNVSSPEAPPAGGIQSPSFQNRTFQTQLTVQDGDTVAIGGIITENDLRSSAGVPVLQRLPGIGAAFGSKSISKSRTELVVFLTPRVIYDASQLIDATDEIKSGMRRIQKLSKDQY